MPLKKPFLSIVVILLALVNNPAQAGQPVLKKFTSGSYQQILASNANQPFMLVVWSITCSSCLKDMALLSSIHKKRPELKMIMLAADDLSEAGQIQTILENSQLSGIENWVYADENTQKLQLNLILNGLASYPEPIFSTRLTSAKVLAAYCPKKIMNRGLQKS